MGNGFCCGCCNCCACECCEPRDDWNITDQIRPGERGAGWLYKRGKSSAVWSKRFFVLTSQKIIYYTDADRQNPKGEIILVGSTSKVSATRNSAKKHYYFTINHAQCGVRELYAKTNVRRSQWVEKINEVCAELKLSGSMFGKLYKQGGMSKNIWQERWSLVVGNCLYYYESSTDTSPKGFLELSEAKVRDFSLKDKPYCFEIVTTKKGAKKYNFCVEKEGERKGWLDALSRAAKWKPTDPVQRSIGGDASGSISVINNDDDDNDNGDTQNPLASGSNRPSDVTSSSALRKCAEPKGKMGKLKKKSPALLTGWQKRFFVLRSPGELAYFENEEEFQKNVPEKGKIDIVDISPGPHGVELTGSERNQIKISMGTRLFELQAKTTEDAQGWIDAIDEWVAYCNDV